MVDREVLLEALSVVCNSKVTSVQKQGSDHGSQATKTTQPLLSLNQLVSTVLDGDEICLVSKANYIAIKDHLAGGVTSPQACMSVDVEKDTSGRLHVIDEADFFDPSFDYDFTKLKDTQIFHRGGEVYERPCGWHRFALKVLDKYDGNTWLGTQCRTTESAAGEWPVSYHGTSKAGADAIIPGFYKPGERELYGRGIYSTPDIKEADYYAKSFVSKKTGKTYKVILQNRINPEYREKHNNDKYWLVPIPKETSDEEVEEMAKRAIRPYGLLLKEMNDSACIIL